MKSAQSIVTPSTWPSAPLSEEYCDNAEGAEEGKQATRNPLRWLVTVRLSCNAMRATHAGVSNREAATACRCHSSEVQPKNRKLVIDKPLDSPRNRRYFVFSSLTYYARRGHSATVQYDQFWWSARPKDIHGGKWDL